MGSLRAAVAYPRPGDVDLVSQPRFEGADCSPDSESGTDQPGGRGAEDSAISASGRFVAFDSNYCDIVPNDDNDMSDVFFHDRKTGTVEMLSVSPIGTPSRYLPVPPPMGSKGPTMSANGRLVAFVSDAVNLTAGSITTGDNVYVRDVRKGTTELISKVGNLPAGVSVADYWDPAISADGRFAAFTGPALFLGLPDTTSWDDVIVHDRLRNTSFIASVDSKGGQTEAPLAGISRNQCPSLSKDGRFVSFSGPESDLVEDDTTIWNDVFVHDTETGTTERVSLRSGDRQANEGTLGTNSCAGGFNHGGGSISGDGRMVVFQSGLSDFVPNDTNDSVPAHDGMDVFVHDRETGRTDRVSVSSYGEEYPAKTLSGGGGFDASLSPDGRYVTFVGPLDLNDPQPPELRTTYEGIGLYVYDRRTFEFERVNLPVEDAGGACLGSEIAGGLTPCGRYVAFSSCFRLAPGDARLTEGEPDVYVRDRGLSLGAGGSSDMSGSMPRIVGLSGFAHRGFASVPTLLPPSCRRRCAEPTSSASTWPIAPLWVTSSSGSRSTASRVHD